VKQAEFKSLILPSLFFAQQSAIQDFIFVNWARNNNKQWLGVGFGNVMNKGTLRDNNKQWLGVGFGNVKNKGTLRDQKNIWVNFSLLL
jgi:hypothetical protein